MTTTQELLATIEKASKEGKKLSLDETLKIIKAYRTIAQNPQLVDKVVYLIVLFSKQEQYFHKLSSRESQILNLIGLGFKSKEMASMLDISLDTVSTHRKNIIKKLQISGTGQLQNFAYQFVQKHM